MVLLQVGIRGQRQVYGYLAEEVMGKDISILEPENLKGETKQLADEIKHERKDPALRNFKIEKGWYKYKRFNNSFTDF